MRRERVLMLGLAVLLGGCVTTSNNSGGNLPQVNMPQASKAEQARDAARVHTELAQHYLSEGDLQDALAKLQLALKFDDNYAPAHTVIAVVYEKIGELPNAEINYRKAQALEPTKGGPNNNLGQFLCRIGKTQESIGYFKKAIADPFYATPDVALTNEGICQLQLHDTAGAEASFRDAIARNPHNGDALFHLAAVLYQQGDAFRARAFIQRFDALGKPSAAALKLGYAIETRLGNTDAARNYLRRLQSQFPDAEASSALTTTTNHP